MNQNENKNALKHGLFAEAVILPGEDEEEFKVLHDSLVEEWNPDGPTEEGAVMNIANAMWRKRRYNRFFRTKVGAFMEKQAYRKKHREKVDEKLLQLLGAIDSGESITEQNILEKLGWCFAEHFKTKLPRANYQSEESWKLALKEEIIELLENSLLKRTTDTEREGLLSDETLVSREAALDERIDAIIDKNIKRLGQSKTMKSMGLGKGRLLPAGMLKQVTSSPPSIEPGKSN